ncbi:hypothetical protein PMAYCL1PPCAC_22881, partial [Pristionchus mayeri]
PIGAVTDGSMMIMYTVTCKADGSGWEVGGQVINSVECTATPLCKTCAVAAPTITKVHVDSKDMAVPPIVNTGTCSTKTFVCEGMMATITPMSGGAPIGAVTDGSMMIMYTVTCKADGSGWEVGGQVINSVECTATPLCKTCAVAAPTITKVHVDSKDMAVPPIVNTGTCSTKTFVCEGMMATITPMS